MRGKIDTYVMPLGEGRKSPDSLLHNVNGLRDDCAGLWIESSILNSCEA
jgi:hypothetical protein